MLSAATAYGILFFSIRQKTGKFLEVINNLNDEPCRGISVSCEDVGGWMEVLYLGAYQRDTIRSLAESALAQTPRPPNPRKAHFKTGSEFQCR